METCQELEYEIALHRWGEFKHIKWRLRRWCVRLWELPFSVRFWGLWLGEKGCETVDRDEKLFLRDLAGRVEPCPPTSRTLQSWFSEVFWWTIAMRNNVLHFMLCVYYFTLIFLCNSTRLQLRQIRLFVLSAGQTLVADGKYRETKCPATVVDIHMRHVRHLLHVLISMKKFTVKVAWVVVYGKRTSFYDGDSINSPG